MKTSVRPTLSRKDAVVRKTANTCCGPASAACNALPSPARVVLIDDDWGALSRLREIIEQNPDLQVVAACRCADGAMATVQQYRPAIVILDVQLPDRDGFELVHDITTISDAKVIVFTAALQKAGIVSALRSGAKAIVFKDQPTSMLISRVRRVLAGEACIVQNLAAQERPGTRALRSVEALSERELEVAQWAAVGARNKVIAWELGISEGTVKLHLFHAYRKLRVSNRVGLVLALRRAASETLVAITFVNLTFV
jgi:two-component system, NarL family, response regulator FusR